MTTRSWWRPQRRSPRGCTFESFSVSTRLSHGRAEGSKDNARGLDVAEARRRAGQRRHHGPREAQVFALAIFKEAIDLPFKAVSVLCRKITQRKGRGETYAELLAGLDAQDKVLRRGVGRLIVVDRLQDAGVERVLDLDHARRRERVGQRHKEHVERARVARVEKVQRRVLALQHVASCGSAFSVRVPPSTVQTDLVDRAGDGRAHAAEHTVLGAHASAGERDSRRERGDRCSQHAS